MQKIKNPIQKFNKFFTSKIITDLIINYASLTILGVTGLILNIIIAVFYNSSTLGIFNQSLAFYMFISMLGSCGINFSVLEAIPKAGKDENEIAAIVKGAILPTIFSSLIITVVFSIILKPITSIFKSDELYKGLVSIIPAIFFCSLNKVLLYGVFNGLRRMKEFAFFQSLRYILILFSLLFLLYLPYDGSYLSFIFSISEIILFPIMFYRINKLTKFMQSKRSSYWILRHLTFGTRAVFTGLITEANTKVDILMIGLFLSDELVGIYSFAALFIEGYVQFIKVIQINYNPLFAKFINLNDLKNINNLVKNTKKLTYIVSIIFAIFLTIIYLPFLNLFISNNDYIESYIPFLLLLLGVGISSGYLPFHEILTMGKYPSENTFFMMIFLAVNILLNLILIPKFGIIGAALATGLSYIFSAYLITYFSKKYLKINL